MISASGSISIAIANPTPGSVSTKYSTLAISDCANITPTQKQLIKKVYKAFILSSIS